MLVLRKGGEIMLNVSAARQTALDRYEARIAALRRGYVPESSVDHARVVTGNVAVRARRQGTRTFLGSDLDGLWSVDESTGCWMWTAELTPFVNDHGGTTTLRGQGLYPAFPGRHGYCHRMHELVSRALKEEQLGRHLLWPGERVVGTCATNRNAEFVHPCVNPDHFEVQVQ